jgi:4-diphosphocytidyl-2-C-methyl-D-erythritol kinase
MLIEFAPAKINLYLHITGRRADGHHILDSLVAFAGVGDEIRCESAPRFDFIAEGPQAALLKKEPADNNLVVRAARMLAEKTGASLDLRLTLIKNVPVASGIGGGSSDAAAALRLLAGRQNLASGNPALAEVAAACGQDVLVCLQPENRYITAGGAETGPELPHTNIVLVNPGKALSTADVYKAFRDGGGIFSAEARFKESPADAHQLAAMLKERSNNLAKPALRLMPEIGEVLKALETSDQCLLARMSGSGATCFGLYPDRDSARRAAADILASHTGWWVIQSHIPSRRDRRRP